MSTPETTAVLERVRCVSLSELEALAAAAPATTPTPIAVVDAQLRAATATMVTPLVGQHGLEQEHVDTLRGPWASTIGRTWETTTVKEA